MRIEDKTKQSGFIIAWLLSYISIGNISANMITPALPKIQSTFYLTPGALGWVVSAFLLGYVIGLLIYAPLANSFGRLYALKWGLNINLYGLLFCCIASYFSSYGLLILGRVMTGLGTAAGMPCIFMLINEWLPEKQVKIAFSYAILSFAIGNGVAIFLGGLITQYFYWQLCFVVLMIHAVVLRIGVVVFVETLQQAQTFKPYQVLLQYFQALRSVKLVVFSMAWGACSVVAYCYSTAAPLIANSYFNLSAARYGSWNTINILGMLVGGLSSRVLLQKTSVMKLMVWGYIGCFFALFNIFFIFFLQSHSVLWFFTSTCLLFCFSSYLFSGGSYTASNAIEDKASASSVMSFINMGLATTATIAMGYFSNHEFFNLLMILVLMFLLTMSLLIIFYKNGYR